MTEISRAIYADLIESENTYARWVEALAASNLEFDGWDEDSPGGPYAVWRIKSTDERIAT